MVTGTRLYNLPLPSRAAAHGEGRTADRDRRLGASTDDYPAGALARVAVVGRPVLVVHAGTPAASALLPRFPEHLDRPIGAAAFLVAHPHVVRCSSDAVALVAGAFGLGLLPIAHTGPPPFYA